MREDLLKIRNDYKEASEKVKGAGREAVAELITESQGIVTQVRELYDPKLGCLDLDFDCDYGISVYIGELPDAFTWKDKFEDKLSVEDRGKYEALVEALRETLDSIGLIGSSLKLNIEFTLDEENSEGCIEAPYANGDWQSSSFRC